MGLRVNKRIKMAPGLYFRLNKKSVGLTVGGKAVHYTVNSAGSRTTSVGVPGTGVYLQNTERKRGRSRSEPSVNGQPPGASSAGVGGTQRPKPPRVSRAERPLFELMRDYQRSECPGNIAAQCLALARQNGKVRITALTLAGLIAMPVDRGFAEQVLSQVFASRSEVADIRFLQRYSPVKNLDVTVDGVSHSVALSRDLIGYLLVDLCCVRGDLKKAAAFAADIRNPLLTQAAREVVTPSSS